MLSQVKLVERTIRCVWEMSVKNRFEPNNFFNPQEINDTFQIVSKEVIQKPHDICQSLQIFILTLVLVYLLKVIY
jgi:hypothetical protein